MVAATPQRHNIDRLHLVCVLSLVRGALKVKLYRAQHDRNNLPHKINVQCINHCTLYQSCRIWKKFYLENHLAGVCKNRYIFTRVPFQAEHFIFYMYGLLTMCTATANRQSCRLSHLCRVPAVALRKSLAEAQLHSCLRRTRRTLPRHQGRHTGNLIHQCQSSCVGVTRDGLQVHYNNKDL